MTDATLAPRFAIYARFSTALQNPQSITDQIALCRRRAESLGGLVTGTYSDPQSTGTTMQKRDGLKRLLEHASAGGFDAILTEALDRLSRDHADIAAIFKHLRFHDVGIITLEEGDINSLHIGFKGVMNEAYVESIAHKTRRGQQGRVREGRAIGRPPYGYRLANHIEPDGTIERGLRAIDEEHARVVQHIFKLYADGMSAREIARLLDAEGVPAPKGKHWSGNALNGERKAGGGILNNELYRGRIIYGRRRLVRDPQTGKRRARLTPESEWTVQEAPALRIVDETLWLRVQARRAMGHDRRRGASPNRQGTPRPLSDLVHCGVCGGRMALINQSRYRCVTRHRNIDNCANARGIPAAELETRAAQQLHDWLISQPNWAAELGRAAQSLSQRRTAIQTRIADTDQRIEALLDAIEAGGPGRKTQRRVIAHEQTLGALKLDLAAIARTPRRPPKELALRLEARAAAFAMTVEHGRGERRRNALLELHELMSRIEVSPGSEPRETIVRLTPQHDTLLALGLARGPVSKKYLDAARAAQAAAAENASPDTRAPDVPTSQEDHSAAPPPSPKTSPAPHASES